MDSKQVINIRQFSWITASVITTGGLISVQNVLVRVERMDSWLAYVGPALYAVLIICFFGFLAQRFPRKHLFEISFLLFGKWFGGLLNAILIFHIWLVMMRDISSVNRFIQTTLLPRTPLEVLSLLFVVILCFYGKTSIEVVARVNDIFLPLLMIMLLLMPVALLNEIRIEHMQPVMVTSISHLVASNVIASGWFADIFLLGAFLHTTFNHLHLKTALRRGTFIATALLTLSMAVEIMVFGPFLPGNFMYPSYNLVQQIHITDFLDRVDIVMLMIWFPVTVCKIIIIYTAMLIGLSSYMKKLDHSVLNKSTGVFLLVTTLLAFRSTTEMFSFGNYSSVFIVFAYQPLFMILFFAAAKLYRKRHPLDEAKNGSGNDSRVSGTPPRDQSVWERISAKFPYFVWRRTSNLLLAAMCAILAAGFLLGRYYPWLGNLCGLLFAVCLALILLSSFAEVKTVEHG